MNISDTLEIKSANSFSLIDGWREKVGLGGASSATKGAFQYKV